MSSYFAKCRHENVGTGTIGRIKRSHRVPTFCGRNLRPMDHCRLSDDSSFVFYTWTLWEEPYCCYFKEDKKADQACIECWTFIQDATSHFQTCPQFSQSFSVRESCFLALAGNTNNLLQKGVHQSSVFLLSLSELSQCGISELGLLAPEQFNMTKVADQSVGDLKFELKKILQNMSLCAK